MEYKKLEGGIQNDKKLENLNAENAALKDMLSFVALMSDIELPENGGGEDAGTSEENAQ